MDLKVIDDKIFLKTASNLFVYDRDTFEKIKDIEDVKKYGIYENDIVSLAGNNVITFYKNLELYHKFKLEIPHVDRFIFKGRLLYIIDKTYLVIYSIIGNKTVLRINLSKSEIKDFIIKDDKIIFANKQALYIYDLLTKTILLREPMSPSLVSSDGKIVAILEAGFLTLLDIKTKKIFLNQKLPPYKIKNLQIYGDYIVFLSEKRLFVGKINGENEIEFQEVLKDKVECFDASEDDLFIYDGEFKKFKLSKLLNKKIKCMTVDDSKTMRLVIKNSILNNFDNVEVLEAGDGKEALEVLEKNPDIQIVFMDWNMPGMNGRDAVIKIRENPKYDHVKVVMATTEGSKEKVHEMIKYGVKGYLVKPLKPDSVISAMEKMLKLIEKEEEDVRNRE